MKQNLLIDTLPDTVEVSGRVFPINSNFRTGILFEMLIFDKTVSGDDKLYQMLSLYYDEIPQDASAAVSACIDFYRCGKPEQKKAQAKKSQFAQKAKQIYDFDYDDSYIFSAFYGQYGIDLNAVDYLHWWKFRALFAGLKDDTEIVKIMGYRSADLSKIKDKNERARLSRLKAIHALPSNLTFEEKVAAAGALFGGVK
jgi:hypothetical protein